MDILKVQAQNLLNYKNLGVYVLDKNFKNFFIFFLKSYLFKKKI